MMQNISCPHQDALAARRVCSHLFEAKDGVYIKHFSGSGLLYDLLCGACAGRAAEHEVPLSDICAECFTDIEREGSWVGLLGEPEIFERPTRLRFTHEVIPMPELPAENVVEIQAVKTSPLGLWVALTAAGDLYSINFSRQSASLIMSLADSTLDFNSPVAMSLSESGEMAAIVNTFGVHGVVLDLTTGTLTMKLERDAYHHDVTPYPVAFFAAEGRTLLIHGTAWNRLDISDPRTGALLSGRGPTSYRRGEQPPAHYLDYFHGRLRVSPGQEWIADDGWVWHPIGGIATWNLQRWLLSNVWESEDGPSIKMLCWRDYYWGGPLCWIDEKTLAVWGYGNDDEWLIPAVRLFDVESGSELRWFAGPQVEALEEKKWFDKPFDALNFDAYLFATSEKHGTSVWDIETGERLLLDASFKPTRYHHGARQFLSMMADHTFRLSRLTEPSAPDTSNPRRP